MLDERREPDGAAVDDPAAPLVLAACRAGDARKARDISALRVSHLTSATSFFVTMVGTSKTQISAIVSSVEDSVYEELGVRAHRQGKAHSGWVCLDYDTVVVNVFGVQERAFYGLDKFWAAGQPLDLSEVLLPSTDSSAGFDEEGGDDEDDWVLDDEDDWGVGDEDWQVDADEWAADGARPGALASVAAAPAVGIDGLDEWAGVNDGGLAEAAEAAEAVALARPADEAAADEAAADEAAADEGAWEETTDDEADWAMGDDALRASVERAERGFETALSEDEEDVDLDLDEWSEAISRKLAADGFGIDKETGEVRIMRAPREASAEQASEQPAADDESAS